MFRDFSSFEIEDFAFDESFQKWVTEDNADHSDFWIRYMEEHPHQIDKILAARELVLKLVGQDAAIEHKDMADTIWTNVRNHVYPRSAWLPRRFRIMHIAAALALLVAATYVFLVLTPVIPQDDQAYSAHQAADSKTFETRANNGDEVMRIDLADGSVVNLEKGSRLTFPKHFSAKERAVQLHGEAFFDIEKNPVSPFIIYASKTVVKVLGTSFRVKAHDDSAKVVVAVKSGKVSFFERKDFETNHQNPHISGLVLMANQQAEFSNELEKFSKTLVPEPMLLATASKNEFDFDRTPLPGVFGTLEKAYGIEIIYDKDLVAGRLLKVSLGNESLFEKLDLICQTMGLTYQIVDARIIIESQ